MRLLVTDKDTICAMATAPGAAAISVIRLSGPESISIIKKIAPFLPEQLESHKIYYGFLKAVDTQSPVDEVLVSYFQEGRSFTGETSFEISCHGGERIVDEVLRQLSLAGARPAKRGEFTFRAFMNGRVDLVQAESILSLIESRSARAANLALRQLKGELSKQLKAILDGLTGILAHLEANIDFASEDIVIASGAELSNKAQAIKANVDEILAGYRRGKIIRNGYQIALVGKPNAGKSSLLNALAGDDRAIVTDIPGTTRDFVEAELEENGMAVTLVDTAGLRVTDDPVEKIGVQRTLEKIAQVDHVFFLVDAGDAGWLDDGFVSLPWEKTTAVVNKIDLNREKRIGFPEGVPVKNISAVTGEGLSELRARVAELLKAELVDDSMLVTNARQYRGLHDLQNALARTVPLLSAGESPDLIALELQEGLRALYEVLGLSYDDQVMDHVFSEFCLGK